MVALAYGSGDKGSDNLDGGINLFNRLLLRKTNHTGSDIRILSGGICSSKAFPRQSVESCWWSWKRGFTTRWKGKSHINGCLIRNKISSATLRGYGYAYLPTL